MSPDFEAQGDELVPQEDVSARFLFCASSHFVAVRRSEFVALALWLRHRRKHFAASPMRGALAVPLN